MHVKVLGSGCMNCTTLERRTREALRQLGLSAEIEKVQEIKEIMSYGLLSTPGLVVDGKLILQGRVPSVEALKELFAGHHAP